MNDSLRESLSYFGLYKKMLRVKKEIKPQSVSFGTDKQQYFLYYEPKNRTSDKVIVWVHGGGWNAGSPKQFDFVGQCACKNGYRFLSLGYRLSPKHKYPCQIEDVCRGYQAAISFLQEKGIDATKIIVSGPSAGAHLSSILCYSKKVQEQYSVDISPVIGFVGSGGPYRFSEKDSLSVGEPCAMMTKSHIPMLLIQSKHDGLISYSCAEHFFEKAQSMGIPCELYSVVDQKNTHSWYTAGMFLETRKTNQGLDKFFTWIENR